jgi:hypothetical protein
MNKETIATLLPWIISLVIVLLVYSFLKNVNVGGNSSGQSLWNYFFGDQTTANPATTGNLVAANGAVANSKSVNTFGDDITYLMNSAQDLSTGGYDAQGDPNS